MKSNFEVPYESVLQCNKVMPNPFEDRKCPNQKLTSQLFVYSNHYRLKIGFLWNDVKLGRRRDLLLVCVVYSSSVCPRCEVLKQYLQNHKIEHTVRMVEEPDAQVDALMLSIYSTPALVIGNNVLHQSNLFPNNHLDESNLIEFLRSNGHGPA